MNTSTLRRTVALLLSMTSLMACVAAPTPAPTPLPDRTVVFSNQAGGDERLRALALRLIAPYNNYTNSAGSVQTPQLIVGGIPDDLPVDLPQPPKATLLGSWRDDDSTIETRIFFDVDDTSVSIIDFYIRALKSQGFSIWTRKPPYINPDPHLNGISFCRTDTNPTEVDVSTVTLPDQPVQLQIAVQTNPQSTPCLWPEGFNAPFSQTMMPDLKTPADAISGLDFSLNSVGGAHGASASMGEGNQSVRFYTKLSVSEVADSYAQQLVAAGWAKAKETNTDEVAWSKWTKTDQMNGEWDGVLLVTAGPIEARERFVVFNIELK